MTNVLITSSSAETTTNSMMGHKIANAISMTDQNYGQHNTICAFQAPVVDAGTVVSNDAIGDTTVVEDTVKVSAETFSEQVDRTKAEWIVNPTPAQSFDNLIKQVLEKCAADNKVVNDTLSLIKTAKAELSNGYPTTAIAGKQLLELVIWLSTNCSEDQKRSYICSLAVGNRPMKYSKRAQTNLAVPLAQYGYGKTASEGHVSKVAAVVGYAYRKGVKAEDFPSFLMGNHTYRKDKALESGYGLWHAYNAAKYEYRDMWTDPEETSAKKCAYVVKKIMAAPIIEKLPATTKLANKDGLYLLLARKSESGVVEVVHYVTDFGGNTISSLLKQIAEEQKISAGEIEKAGIVLPEPMLTTEAVQAVANTAVRVPVKPMASAA